MYSPFYYNDLAFERLLLITILQNLAIFGPLMGTILFTANFYRFTGKMILPLVLLIYRWYGKTSRLPTLLPMSLHVMQYFEDGI